MEQQRRAIAALFAAVGAAILFSVLSIVLSAPTNAADVDLVSETSAQTTFELPGAEPQLRTSTGFMDDRDAPLFNAFGSPEPSALLTSRLAGLQSPESKNEAAISGVVRGPGGAPLAPGTSGDVTLYDRPPLPV